MPMFGAKKVAPGCSELQRAAALKSWPAVPRKCVVTGGTGFVGQRLVEMLVERGAESVVSLDVVPPPPEAWKDPAIDWRICDVTDRDAVVEALKGADCVWHNAAAVGPFHPKPLYKKVNYEGTLNVIAACRQNGIKKLVFSSSPSTRFVGGDVDGPTEDGLPGLPLKRYLQDYAETKAMGEMAVSAATDLLTISVAPHQVYGPRDNLFLPNMLENAGNGRLRVFGKGKNRICFTHVDNYCHGLIIAETRLKPDSDVLGKFYIVTDGNTHPGGHQYLNFWDELDRAIVGVGFDSIVNKTHLPIWFLMFIATIAEFVAYLLGTKFKLNRFNVKVLTMHRWFDIHNACRDLDYRPVLSYEDAWPETIQWFKDNWLPTFKQDKSLFGISDQSQKKIDIQESSALKK